MVKTMEQSKERKKQIKEIQENSSKNDYDGKRTQYISPHPITHAKIPPYAWKVLVILSCIATMVMYAETMLIPAIPTLIDDFDVSYGLSSWLLTSYLISGAVMTPIAGKLSDTYGRKKVLLIIMVIYTAGVSVGGFANDIYTLIVSRAIQGIGMSMFPIAFGIVRDQFPKEKISIAQGAITSMFAAGSVIGLSIGAFIIQHFGWRMTFFTIIPISIIILLVIRKYIHIDDNYNYETEVQKKLEKGVQNNNQIAKHSREKEVKDEKTAKIQIDIKGSVLLAFTITSFLLALTLLQTPPNSNLTTDTKGFPNYNAMIKTILPFVILGTVSLALFVYVEKHTKFPLMDFKIFLKPPILLSSVIIMIVGMSMFMVFQTIPILVQSPEPIGFGDDSVETGKIQLPFAIMLLIFGPTSGIIISKLGSLKPIIFGSMLTTCGFIVLFLFHSSELLISTSLGILSAGLSLSAVGAMNIIILGSPRESAGVTIGMSSMLRIVGSSVGPALAAMYMQTNQSVINVNGVPESLPSSVSFDLIFFTAIMLSIASITVSMILSKKTRGKEVETNA
ncbi:MAG TPA: MFS transporter [Phototrophicaceae bacterium]|nr:MFS transporter [Phototrophicaceae bacterium]